MGLMDKFKNLFTDEEFDDEEEEIEEPVKIKEVKKTEPKKGKDKLPTFMREKLEKEEKEEKKNNDEVSDFKLNEDINKEFEIKNNSIDIMKKDDDIINKRDDNFKFPFDFDENDFNDIDISRISRQSRTSKKNSNSDKHPEEPHIKLEHTVKPKKEVKVAELYKDKKEEKIDIKKFTATPIISPIYGVLDKNYRKEELEPISGDNYEINRPSKTIDFDSVRKKAYGNNTLVEDIKNNMICENCDYFKKAKSCSKGIEEDDLMYEALCEKNEKSKDITLDEATENYYDYGVEYEKSNDIDSYDDLDDVKIVSHTEEATDEPQKTHKTKKNEVPPVKSSINLLSTLKKSMGNEEEEPEKKEKNLELTDDLFNLIDSMYDEGNE